MTFCNIVAAQWCLHITDEEWRATWSGARNGNYMYCVTLSALWSLDNEVVLASREHIIHESTLLKILRQSSKKKKHSQKNVTSVITHQLNSVGTTTELLYSR